MEIFSCHLTFDITADDKHSFKIMAEDLDTVIRMSNRKRFRPALEMHYRYNTFHMKSDSPCISVCGCTWVFGRLMAKAKVFCEGDKTG